MNGNFQTYVVVNPHSAAGRTGKEWPRTREAIRAAIGPFESGLTRGPGEAVELTRTALRRGFEMIVSVGGDGTNNEMVNGFFEGEKPVNPEAVLAVLPSGTGGDLARTLGIRDLPLPRRAETLKGREASPADVGLVSFRDHRGQPARRYFINLASLGLGGEVDAVVNASSKRFGAKPTFLIGGFRVSVLYRNKLVRYRVDDGPETEEKIYSIYLALGQYAGGGMRFAPGARLGSGHFELVITRGLSKLQALRYALRTYSGRHLEMPQVRRLPARKLRAESPDEVFLDLDGENPGRLPAEFDILPGQICLKQLKATITS